MKSIKLYLTLLALLLAFNGSLSARLRINPDESSGVVNPTSTSESVKTAEFGLTPSISAPATTTSSTTTTSIFDPTPVNKVNRFQELSDKLCFSDLGVNSEGIIVGIGLDGQLYEYAFAENTFYVIKTEYEISNLWRVDINYDGIIYAITRCGDTYKLDCKRRWIKLPGCAIDIGAGRSGEVFKIGCEKPGDCTTGGILDILGSVKPSSPHVYKLICSCNCKCGDRRCKVFLKKYEYKTCEPAEKTFCYWIKLPSYKKGFNLVKFTRIDANSTGHPIVTDGVRDVYEFFGGDENKFKLIHQAPLDFSDITDVTSDNDGVNYYCTEKACYEITGLYTVERFVDQKGDYIGASNVSVGPFSMISFIKKGFIGNNRMYTTAKVGFN